jgi:DNA-binding response OmpR family regulator
MARKLLLIDDDALMRRSLAFNLEQVGYHVQTGSNAEDGIQMARLDKPDLVVLDIGLPGMDGLEAVRVFKDQIGAPVIFLTARRRELDEILGLEMGADDYITKPFDLDVLIAHIKAVLRRSASPTVISEPTIIQVGDIRIDPASHTVMVQDKVVDLSPKEFDLLATLASHPGQVVTNEELLSQVWGAEYEGQPQVVYVNIRWIRQKIESDPDHPQRLQTVHSVGYKLVPKEA